jgi:hypothetical protein
MKFEGPATDGLALQHRHDEHARGWPHLRERRGDALPGIETSVETSVELGEVLPEAELRSVVRGIDRVDLDR